MAARLWHRPIGIVQRVLNQPVLIVRQPPTGKLPVVQRFEELMGQAVRRHHRRRDPEHGLGFRQPHRPAPMPLTEKEVGIQHRRRRARSGVDLERHQPVAVREPALTPQDLLRAPETVFEEAARCARAAIVAAYRVVRLLVDPLGELDVAIVAVIAMYLGTIELGVRDVAVIQQTRVVVGYLIKEITIVIRHKVDSVWHDQELHITSLLVHARNRPVGATLTFRQRPAAICILNRVSRRNQLVTDLENQVAEVCSFMQRPGHPGPGAHREGVPDLVNLDGQFANTPRRKIRVRVWGDIHRVM